MKDEIGSGLDWDDGGRSVGMNSRAHSLKLLRDWERKLPTECSPFAEPSLSAGRTGYPQGVA